MEQPCISLVAPVVPKRVTEVSQNSFFPARCARSRGSMVQRLARKKKLLQPQDVKHCHVMRCVHQICGTSVVATFWIVVPVGAEIRSFSTRPGSSQNDTVGYILIHTEDFANFMQM